MVFRRKCNDTDFGFKAVPRIPPPHVFSAYNIESKATSAEGFPIMDLIDAEVDYTKFINKYLM